MKRTFEITLNVDIPTNRVTEYVGDERTCRDIKNLLLGETPKEVKPEIEVRVRKDDKIKLLEKVKHYFVEECEDGDGVKTGDYTITKDSCEVAEYIDSLIDDLMAELKGGAQC